MQSMQLHDKAHSGDVRYFAAIVKFAVAIFYIYPFFALFFFFFNSLLFPFFICAAVIRNPGFFRKKLSYLLDFNTR